MGRLGGSWAELGRSTADCSKAVSYTECQRSAQAQLAHHLHRHGSYPIGPQLGRDGHWHGRLPRAIDLTSDPPSRPRRNRDTLKKLTPRLVGGPDYNVINTLSRDIRVAERSSHIKDMAERSCRLL